MSVLCSGSFVADILVPDLPHIGPPGSLTYAPNGIILSPGGHSGNVAIDLTQLGVKDVHAAGSVGNDMMGEFLVEQLNSSGVIVHSEIQEGITTAKNIALLVRGQDRRFIAELTANSLLTPRFLTKTMDTVKPKIFYQGTLGGLPYIEEELVTILRHVKRLGSLTLVDVIMPSTGWGYLEPALPEIDILHCNIDEGRNLTGLNDSVDIIRALLDNGPNSVVLTDGNNGLIAGTQNFLVEMPAFNVEQIDPTGAGDALFAGIINFLSHHENPNVVFKETIFKDALVQGQAAGAACVTGVWATTNVQHGKVSELLKSQEEILEKTKTMIR